jgi:NADH:ubiquinone oxidoreductase subunit 6 (subunit J)
MGESIYWPSVFFLLFGGIACAFAVAVVVSANIVRMAFYLVMSLAATAGLFFLAGADFVGAMQILIYVGGTLVLLVFGVMLTSQDRFISMKTSRFEMGLAAGVGACLFILLFMAAMSVPEWRGLQNTGDLTPRQMVEKIPVEPTGAPVGLALLGIRVDNANASGYLLVFEIISVHLLVVLIGAAYLARAQRKRRTVAETG